MAGRVTARDRVRFGVFELHLETGELRKSGVLLHLPPQPFKVLTLLASRRGQLVTREEIRDQIWGSETFVDFDHGLNFAIKKIRDTLGDDPETPRYIETVPRRGYRFIAPVEAGAESPERVPASGPDGAAPAGAGRPRVASLQGRWMLVAGSGAVLAIAALLLALNAGSLRDRLLTAMHLKSALTPPRYESIAVLPFENLSRDPEQEYFADGLTDALITDLGQIVTLRVISRTSVMQYKGAKKPLPQIARELNVDAVVEGTVQRSGGRARITAQLLEARTDRHLWAESYERGAEDVIGLEKQVALAIAHEISGRLTTVGEARLASTRTTNPRAYDAYLHGRHLWGERTAEPETAARAYFEQALREDPDFALAYSGLADYYSVSWFVKTDPVLAEKYARKAVALEPELAEGHASLGIAAVYQHKFAEGEKELRRAIDLNPNYAMAHHWYSLYFIALARPTEALAENDRARQLDPFSFPINFLRGAMLFGLHEYDRAVEQFGTAAAINPQSPSPHGQLARIYWIEGRVPEALAEERKVATLGHDPALFRDQEEIARVYAQSDLRGAQLKAAQLREKGYERDQRESAAPSHDSYSAFAIALQYALLKDREKALDWLDQAGQERTSYFTEALMSAPEFDFLHSDPGFRDFLRGMDYPP
jgi:TolB-like protein/DNA-binding winged helix-turn-helix (wHTH) protein/Tfp pilus assembly protein PilF